MDTQAVTTYNEKDIRVNRSDYLFTDRNGALITGKITCMNGSCQYVVSGKYHRTDGPAVIDPDGFIEWWWNDVSYLFDDYVIKAGWTEDQIVEYKLTHAISF